jgi:ParB family chromosome partitioning protein
MSKAKTGGLGKGLGALIRMTEENRPEEAQAGGADAATPAGSGLAWLGVGLIRPNPNQPRATFNPDALGELADSIREHGLIQPLIVTAEGPDDYILIAGERRWRAARLAGLDQVPVVVKSATTPLELLELALVENIQRADLNPIEEGSAYRQLIDEFGLTQEEVARRVGKGRSTVANMVRLLELAEPVQQAVTDGVLSGGHARALATLSPDQQMAVLGVVLKRELNVRQTEEIVRKLKEQVVPPKKVRPQLSADLADLERQFRTRLGTRVQIEHGKQGGKIVIHYYSDEELDSIYNVIIDN